MKTEKGGLMGVKKERQLNYTVIFEPAEEGGYIVMVPALPGCVTEGDTLEEARHMAKGAIEGYVETLMELGQPVPQDVPAKRVFEELTVTVLSAE